MLWTEKYRPNNLNDIVGQEHFTMDAKSWVEEHNMPNVLLFGNPGNGKTAAGIALAKTMLSDAFRDNFVEVNASDDRRLETVRTTIKSVAQSGTIGDVPFRIMLLDEMDGMTSDAQNALKRIMERYSSNIRFIITCNDRNKIIFALQSRCANYRFNPLSHEVILEEYSEGLELLLSNKNSALLHLQKLLVQGRSIKEICIGLHDAVINNKTLEPKIKFKFLRAIGEAEWRSTTMTPKVLLSWMVGQV